jgi:hypothetical protein
MPSAVIRMYLACLTRSIRCFGIQRASLGIWGRRLLRMRMLMTPCFQMLLLRRLKLINMVNPINMVEIGVGGRGGRGETGVMVGCSDTWLCFPFWRCQYPVFFLYLSLFFYIFLGYCPSCIIFPGLGKLVRDCICSILIKDICIVSNKNSG